MAWLKAGVGATIIVALIVVAALIAISIVQKGVEPMSLAALIVAGLPLALVVVAPVALVILPIAAAVTDADGGRLLRHMAVVGAVAGAFIPLIAIFVLKIRPPGMIGTITALLVLAGLVAGALAGLFFAEILSRAERP